MEQDRLVLVADGSESFAFYLSILLRRMDFRTLSAKSGIEALKLLQTTTPDVIILGSDLLMLEGAQALRNIREVSEPAAVPILVVAADGGGQQEQWLQEGASACLSKPINIAELNQKINGCLHGGGRQKRKVLRAPFQEQVQVSLGGDQQQLWSLTLSERGIYMRTPHPPEEGTELEVTFCLGEEELCLKGTVLYTRKVFGEQDDLDPGMAVLFSDLNLDEARLIKQHVQNILAADLLQEQRDGVLELDKD